MQLGLEIKLPDSVVDQQRRQTTYASHLWITEPELSDIWRLSRSQTARTFGAVR